jgi:hypothetical protein
VLYVEAPAAGVAIWKKKMLEVIKDRCLTSLHSFHASFEDHLRENTMTI